MALRCLTFLGPRPPRERGWAAGPSAMLRITATSMVKALKASGTGGVFLRPVGQLDELDSAVVWFEDGTTVEKAAEVVATEPRALGLALGDRGSLGVRVRREAYVAMQRRLHPEDERWQLDVGVKPTMQFQIEGWPYGTSASQVATAMAAAGWPSQPLRSYVQKGAVTWIVGAEAAPAESLFSVGGQTIFVSPAPKAGADRRPARGPPSRSWGPTAGRAGPWEAGAGGPVGRPPRTEPMGGRGGREDRPAAPAAHPDQPPRFSFGVVPEGARGAAPVAAGPAQGGDDMTVDGGLNHGYVVEKNAAEDGAMVSLAVGMQGPGADPRAGGSAGQPGAAGITAAPDRLTRLEQEFAELRLQMSGFRTQEDRLGRLEMRAGEQTEQLCDITNMLRELTKTIGKDQDRRDRERHRQRSADPEARGSVQRRRGKSAEPPTTSCPSEVGEEANPLVARSRSPR